MNKKEICADLYIAFNMVKKHISQKWDITHPIGKYYMASVIEPPVKVESYDKMLKKLDKYEQVLQYDSDRGFKFMTYIVGIDHKGVAVKMWRRISKNDREMYTYMASLEKSFLKEANIHDKLFHIRQPVFFKLMEKLEELA